MGLLAVLMTIVLATVGPFRPAEEPPVARPPDFTARYENPIYASNGEHGGAFDNYGARWFDFWKEGIGFAHSPQATDAKNCLDDTLHSCIHLAEFLFAVPPPGAKPGAVWFVTGNGLNRFRLLAVAKVRFRGKDIQIHAIKVDRVGKQDGPAASSTVFSYNYDWGVIGYADLISENFRLSERRSPTNLEAVSPLVSEHGLGGQENCKFWKCGSLTPRK